MRKIKSMLIGIAILAVVAGFFAFKAKTNYGVLLLYTTAPTSAFCNIVAGNISFTSRQPQVPIYTTSVYYTMSFAAGTCAPLKGYLRMFN